MSIRLSVTDTLSLGVLYVALKPVKCNRDGGNKLVIVMLLHSLFNNLVDYG